MKISASIYARHPSRASTDHGDSPSEGLSKTVQELDRHGVDYLHIDCRDNPGVFSDIAQIRKISSTPLDLHLITAKPETYYPQIVASAPEMVCIQFETLEQPWEVPTHLPSQLGLAVVADTPVEVLAPYADKLDFVLFMTTTPGVSGGAFNKENFRRIRDFSRMYPGLRIHVDGGVNQEISFVLRNMGVYAAVSGSFLFSEGDSPGPGMLRLTRTDPEPNRLAASAAQLRVADFMFQRDEIPLLQFEALNVPAVLQCIEDFKMGFCMVEDADRKLKGIISMADIRRAMLGNLSDLNAIQAKDLINTQPFCVTDLQHVTELLQSVKACPFPVIYVPVTNSEGAVRGALKFNNLIKGEA